MTTTRGFDLVGEFRNTVPNSIANAFWRAGILPSHIPVGDIGSFKNLEIFLDSPSISITPGNSAGALIADLRQQAILRADNRPGEWGNALLIRAPIVLRDTVIDGLPAQILVLDFADAQAFRVKWEDFTQAGVFEASIAGSIQDSLRTLNQQFPISPASIGVPLRVFPIAGDAPLALKLYCTLDGREGTPPDGTQDALLDQLPPFQAPPDDLAVAIDGPRLLALLNRLLVAKGLVKGGVLVDDAGKRIMDLGVHGSITIDPNTDIPFFPNKITLPLNIDLSPTLQRIKLTSPLSISLGNGYVQLRGSVHAAIDRAPDVDADFDLRVALHIMSSKVTAYVRRAAIDVDSTIYQIIAASFFLPAAWLIADAVDKAIDTAASDEVAGMSISEDIPLRTFLLGDVALTNAETADRPVVLRVVPSDIFIRPDAVVLQMNIKGEAPGAAPLVRPQYLTGHMKTKQVHRPGCSFGSLIKAKNRELFVHVSDALAKGYDGCRKCMADQDGEGVGRLAVTYVRAIGPGKKRTTPAVVSGVYSQGSKQPAFQKPWSLTGTLTPANLEGIWMDRFEIPDLAPGMWSINLTDGNWVVTKQVSVTGGKTAGVGITYGKDAPPVGPEPGVGMVDVRYRVPKAEHLKKRVDVLFQGRWLGTSDGPDTAPWMRDAGVDFADGADYQAQHITMALREGSWEISVLEYGKEQSRTVLVKIGETESIVFERPIE